jgi:hypothetical protein
LETIMTFRTARLSVALAGVLSTLAFTACGSALSASSSCHDFMNASGSAQHEIVDQLAGRYHKAAYATPLGEPEVPYYCSANPAVTLGQFFERAEG